KPHLVSGAPPASRSTLRPATHSSSDLFFALCTIVRLERTLNHVCAFEDCSRLAGSQRDLGRHLVSLISFSPPKADAIPTVRGLRFGECTRGSPRTVRRFAPTYDRFFLRFRSAA